jgi:hypothetical protein
MPTPRVRIRWLPSATKATEAEYEAKLKSLKAERDAALAAANKKGAGATKG